MAPFAPARPSQSLGCCAGQWPVFDGPPAASIGASGARVRHLRPASLQVPDAKFCNYRIFKLLFCFCNQLHASEGGARETACMLSPSRSQWRPPSLTKACLLIHLPALPIAAEANYQELKRSQMEGARYPMLPTQWLIAVVTCVLSLSSAAAAEVTGAVSIDYPELFKVYASVQSYPMSVVRLAGQGQRLVAPSAETHWADVTTLTAPDRTSVPAITGPTQT